MEQRINGENRINNIVYNPTTGENDMQLIKCKSLKCRHVNWKKDYHLGWKTWLDGTASRAATSVTADSSTTRVPDASDQASSH